MIKTTVHGYPKVGPNRELKRAIESYWKGNLSLNDLEETFKTLRRQRIEKIQAAGVNYIPSNDFSCYDFMLDTSLMLGMVPNRFEWDGQSVSRDLYFGMARGTDKAVACELTKWFDTNYHYIVPELTDKITLKENTPLKSYQFAKDSIGVETKPVLVGPFTYVYLSKLVSNSEETVKATDSKSFDSLVQSVASTYRTILQELQAKGVKTVQFDEPALTMDLSKDQLETLFGAYNRMVEDINQVDIHVQTYYESVSDFQDVVFNLPVQGFGLDFVVNGDNLTQLKKHGFPKDKTLIAGVIDGRNIWKTDLSSANQLVQTLLESVSEDRLILSNAAPLFHLPVSTQSEKGHLDPSLLDQLAFADERLEELNQLKAIVNGTQTAPTSTLQAFHDRYNQDNIRKQLDGLNEERIGRETPFRTRYTRQMEVLNLPLFPTTTIGSFPQTPELRKKRLDWKKGDISDAEYETYINRYIDDVVTWQEDLDLDVLVHGEPERTDMVEFFGQKLDGFAFTKNGWVQSYGSRCVRPPIIFGDVLRSEAMTVKETVYAQSKTSRPMKGMLTGSVTILNWSFPRKDIARKDIAYQISLALKEEVLDLEKSGIKVIQIDEPAFREGLPLKKSKQKNYLDWAVVAFKLTHDTVRDETQIHTHMCYSEFNEIIDSIHAMDADVISIEASRSKGEMLEVYEKFKYDLGIGLGVYDIHSPRVPSVEEMDSIAQRSVKVLSKELVWINPDCGLKTRGFDETSASLEKMVTVAKSMRARYEETSIGAVLAESH